MDRSRCWLVAVLALALACSKSGSGEAGPGSTGGAGANGTSGATNAGASPGSAGTTTTAGTSHGGSESDGKSDGKGGGSGGTAGETPSAGTAGGGGGSWPFPAGVTKPRIMIVGDSISAGPGCYKKYLLQKLTENGYTKLEFVGQYDDDCGGGVKHSAVSCSTAAQYAQAMFMMPNCAQGTSFPGLSTLMPAHNPDLVMLQLGVNDVWGNTPTATTLENYGKLVTQARAHNPNVVIVLAQIQKIRPDCGDDDSVQKRAEELVMAVPAWAKDQSTAQSPVFVADLWTNSDWTMAETSDCVHPNDAGAQRMGQNWYDALKGILKPN
jgi:hypothetical protein